MHDFIAPLKIPLPLRWFISPQGSAPPPCFRGASKCPCLVHALYCNHTNKIITCNFLSGATKVEIMVHLQQSRSHDCVANTGVPQGCFPSLKITAFGHQLTKGIRLAFFLSMIRATTVFYGCPRFHLLAKSALARPRT